MKNEYDIIVAGAGLAGVMAGIAAAREGKSVLITEKYGFPGGMATAGLVNPFMPYWERTTEDKRTYVNEGLFRKLTELIYSVGGNKGPRDTSFMEEFMKIVLDRMMKENGVSVLYHALVSDVDFSSKSVNSITVSTCAGNFKLKARLYIDATGDADLCAFAGLDYKLGRESDGLCQPMTLCFRLINVDWSKFDRANANKLYNEFQQKGLILNPRENILLFRMPVDNIMHLNTTRIVGKNPVDPEELSQAEVIAREQVYEMYTFLKNNIPGMENCMLMNSAPEIGIRESRRIVGDYTLTEEDVLSAKKFDDRIARGTYDIDIHNPSGTGTVIKSIPENDFYTIPYRALLPVKADNVIVAGRPISSTHEAHSSLRIMPITTCIGEAAGTAAAIAVQKDVAARDISVTELQDRLTRYGALI